MDSIDRIKQLNEQRAEDVMKAARHNDLLDSDAQTQEVILRSFQTLVQFMGRHVTKTEVINQLRSIGTPDVLELIPHIESLHETLKTHENVDLSEITSVMQAVLDETKKIPKELPELVEKEDRDYTSQFKGLQDAIQAVEQVVKAQKLIAEAPIVNVPETTVNVEKPDLKPLSDGLSNVVKAVKAIVIPEYRTDNAEVEKLLKKTNKTLLEILDKPVGGGGGGSSWVAVNQEGIAQPITLTADGKVPVAADSSPDAIQNVEMINALRALLQQIAVPSWFDPTTNTLRVGTTAVTVSSGTVTTVTNLTNFGTNAADVMARDISINTWANTVRSTIS